MRILINNRRFSFLSQLEENVLNEAIVDLMNSTPYWQGTATDLLETLRKSLSEDQKKDKTFPKIANRLSRALNSSTTTLKQFGITIERSDSANHKNRSLTLRYEPNQSLARETELFIWKKSKSPELKPTDHRVHPGKGLSRNHIHRIKESALQQLRSSKKIEGDHF